MPEAEDLYRILQVHPSAHPDVILAAYRRLALLYHPDRNSSPEAPELMTRLNHAFEVLGDSRQREAYDRARETQHTQRTETRSHDTQSGRPRTSRPTRGSASQSRTATPTTPPKTGFTKADKITVGAIGLAVVVAIVMSAIFAVGGPGNGDDGDSRSVAVSPTQTPVPATTVVAALAPKHTPTPLPSPTAAPTITPQPARVGYFTLGSSQNEVYQIQGPPSGIHTYASRGYEHWNYSSSKVTFSLPERQVKEWVNKGNLKVRLGETSTPAPMSTAKATPTASLSPIPTPLPLPTVVPTALSTRIPTPTPNPAETPKPTATLSSTPTPLPLPTSVPTPTPPVVGGDYFTRGSSQEDVLHVQGTPDEIKVYSASKEEVWYYGNPVYVRSTVTFSLPDRRVKAWDNGDGSLKFRLELSDSSPVSTVTPTLTPTPLTLPTSVPAATAPTVRGGYFTRGSSQDDVLHAQGTPTGIETYQSLGKEIWSYGYSSVTISSTDGWVTEWSDRENNLKVQLLPKTGNSQTPGYFTRGSSQDDVLHAQGTPTGIETYQSLGKEIWSYGYSSVTISSTDGRVIEWSDRENSLKIQ